jgi:hypothetical protein
VSTPPSLSLRRDDLSDAEGEWSEKLLTALTSFGNQTQDAFDHNISITANLNATLKTLQIAMKDDWIAPTLLNSWVSYPSPSQSAQYRKHNGLVEIRGRVRNGSLNNTIFVLPNGYIPSNELSFAVVQSIATASFARIRVDGLSGTVPGTVYVYGTDNTGITLQMIFAPSDPSPVPNPVFPVTFKHGLKGTARPSFVLVVDALDVTEKSSGVHVSTTVTWQASGDSVRIEDLPGLHANRTYKVTFLVIGE